MTIIGIALYMYLLYKEVKIFQDEIVVMKAQISHMQNTYSQPQQPEIPTKVVELPSNINEIEIEDDDSHSVTSNEIKNILTNINDDTDDEEEQEVVPDETTTVTKSTEDLSKMSVEDLTLLKYDVLREYLRLHKKNIKGTKAELVKRISELA